MFEHILECLTHRDLDRIGYEMTRRMRRHKPLDPLYPVAQCKPIELSDDLLKVVDQVQAEIETKYRTKIDRISDEDEEKILNRLYEMSMERFRASPGYDPEQGKKLVEELIHTVPYHKNIRYGSVEVIDGQLTSVAESERMRRGEKRGEKRGKLKAKQEDVLKLMQLRFGNVPEPVVKRVKSIHHLSRLNTLFEQAALAKSLSEIEID
jgi:hypothetical protein